MPQWHTSDMGNPLPSNPRVNDTWIDDDGELHVWDGTQWALYEDPSRLDDVEYGIYRES